MDTRYVLSFDIKEHFLPCLLSWPKSEAIKALNCSWLTQSNVDFYLCMPNTYQLGGDVGTATCLGDLIEQNIVEF